MKHTDQIALAIFLLVATAYAMGFFTAYALWGRP